MVQNTSSQDVKRKVYHFYRKGRAANQLQEGANHTVVEYGDQLLAQQSCKDGVSTCTVLTVDQQRTVLYRAGQYQSRQPLVYTPYGQPSQHPGWLGFNGERPDPITLHYLLGNGYRGFNPVLMRFNSPDSMSPFGVGGLNAYSYCRQDPVNYQDPSGNSRVGRFFLNLFGRFAGGRRHEAPTKEIFSAIYANVTPLLVASMKPFGRKNGGGNYIKLQVTQEQVTTNVTTGNPLPAGYEYLGVHGSSEMQMASLQAGVDVKHNVTTFHGRGFYYSPNIKTAEHYALEKPGGRGYVYGVYGESAKLTGHIDQYRDGDYRVVRREGIPFIIVRDFIQYPQIASEVRR